MLISCVTGLLLISLFNSLVSNGISFTSLMLYLTQDWRLIAFYS